MPDNGVRMHTGQPCPGWQCRDRVLFYDNMDAGRTCCQDEFLRHPRDPQADRPPWHHQHGWRPAFPKAFPLDAFTEACQTVMQRDGAAALQYSTTEGFAPLRQAIADFLPWVSIRSRS